MNYSIEHISGNSYYVFLSPENEREKALLQKDPGDPAIEQHYKNAKKGKFPDHIKVASLTPNDDFPYSPTIELFSISGSI